MNPATPVTTQTLGAETQLFAKMGIRCGDHELTVEGYPPGRFRAVVRGSTPPRSCAPHRAAILGDATKHLPFPPSPRLSGV